MKQNLLPARAMSSFFFLFMSVSFNVYLWSIDNDLKNLELSITKQSMLVTSVRNSYDHMKNELKQNRFRLAYKNMHQTLQSGPSNPPPDPQIPIIGGSDDTDSTTKTNPDSSINTKIIDTRPKPEAAWNPTTRFIDIERTENSKNLIFYLDTTGDSIKKIIESRIPINFETYRSRSGYPNYAEAVGKRKDTTHFLYTEKKVGTIVNDIENYLIKSNPGWRKLPGDSLMVQRKGQGSHEVILWTAGILPDSLAVKIYDVFFQKQVPLVRFPCKMLKRPPSENSLDVLLHLLSPTINKRIRVYYLTLGLNEKSPPILLK